MKLRTLAWLGLSAMVVLSAAGRAQEAGYPMTLIPTGKGPFTFPEGFQIPWDRIQIMVTEKMSPNLFVLHGSQGLDPAHPDASHVIIVCAADFARTIDRTTLSGRCWPSPMMLADRRGSPSCSQM